MRDSKPSLHGGDSFELDNTADNHYDPESIQPINPSDFKSTGEKIDERTFFAEDTNEWPVAGAKYFTREHQQTGDGMRGLVYNSLIDSKRETCFNSLGSEEINHHLHLTNIHKGITQAKSKEVCRMTHYTVNRERTKQRELVKAMEDSYQDAIKSHFSEDQELPKDVLDSMMEKIKTKVDNKMDDHYKKTCQQQMIEDPTDYNTVRRSYLEGTNSILKKLPVPDVDIILTHFLLLVWMLLHTMQDMMKIGCRVMENMNLIL